jgi:uncharacterized protein YjiK
MAVGGSVDARRIGRRAVGLAALAALTGATLVAVTQPPIVGAAPPAPATPVLQVAETTTAPTAALATTATATLIQAVDLGTDLDPLSTDASGITWTEDRDELIVADSEVIEDDWWEGANMWLLDTTKPPELNATGSTEEWSEEPTGIAYNPDTNRVYTTDDNDLAIYEVPVGADLIPGTGDDGAARSVDTTAFGYLDPEGITYDPSRGWLHAVDGSNSKVFSINLGTNGVLDQADPVTSFPVTARDPEGIAYHEGNDTVTLVDYSTNTRTAALEYNIDGTLARTINLGSGSGLVHPAGATWAPSSTGSGLSLWVVDRGEDGGDLPPDAQLFEFSVPPLDGTPSGANISVQSALGFGSVPVGQTLQKDLVVTNAGSSTLNVTSTTITGGSLQFSVSNGGSFSLAAGASRTLAVSYTPASQASHTATLTIASNDPDQPSAAVSLTGTGTAALVPDVASNPTSVAFPSTEVGTVIDRTVTLSNAGTGTLSVSSTTISGSGASHFSIVAGGGTFNLASGATRNVSVRFRPQSLGTANASLVVASNDPDEASYSVPLSGTGISATVPEPVSIEPACSEAGEDGFGDVSADNTHEEAIDCIVFWEISTGVRPGVYGPSHAVTRGQMASFIARFIDNSGGSLPSNPDDAFPDDDGTTHELATNQLADLGIVGGRSDGTFGESDVVSRSQMATFIIRALELRLDGEVNDGAPVPDYFTDDDGSTHEDNINKAAFIGATGGTGGTTFGPNLAVRRDQMASFIARALAVLVEEGIASVP